MMMIPRRHEFDLFEDMFGESFFNEGESKLMKTDIKEKKDKYIIDMDLPGYEKEDIEIDVNDSIKEIEELIKDGKKTKDAVSIIASKYNISKNNLYNEYIKHK